MHWPDALRKIVRPLPVDWTRGAGRGTGPRPARVDIIVPVFGAAAELRACLASITAHTDLSTHRLVLVVDGPQDLAVEGVIETARQHATVLRNDERAGFAASVNRGMAASSTDVVLLNSDAVVTPRWLEKLTEAACSDGDVGTVTPLSNHATLCSVPRGFEENLLPAGYDADSFAQLVERVSTRSYPPLPTGVGFCLYIRRALLDDIGLFDAARFAGGYGEENDFCMRALARGWLHVADDATYVHHAGHRSFGASSHHRERRARKRLARLHPRYMATIAEFMRRDPMTPVRERIVAALRSTATPSNDARNALRIAHLVHGWPPFDQAGTENYASWLVRRQRGLHHVAVYTRSADPSRADGDAIELVDHGVRVRLITNRFTQRNPLRRNAIRDQRLEQDFESFLASEHPDILHIHHLGGHAFSLASVAHRLGIPIVMQIQDWWFVCARVNQLHRDGMRCSGPAPGKCESCAVLTRVPPAAATNRAMHAFRRRAARKALRTADAFVAGSRAIRDDYAGVVPASTPFDVIEYGIDFAPARREHRTSRRPIRLGYIGTVGPHKGVHVAVEAMRGVPAQEATLHVWGNASGFPGYVDAMNAPAGVVFEGRFEEEEKARVLDSFDVLLMPSIALESFGFVAREAMARGVPVIASSGSALSEMFEPDSCGDFFPAGDALALRSIILRIAADPSILARWAAHLPLPKSMDTHAAEIEEVYRSVLRRRR